MWPKLLDMETDECRRVLRRLELEAYSSVISAFRAQGDLTPEKKSLLRSVATTLSISTDRHKAEVRRAVNDEKLTTIAERTGGENSSTEWSVEGRRLIPLMPRFIPQTAYTVLANQAANMAHAHNATLAEPKDTANREGTKGDGRNSPESDSATPSHIVLPPGTVLPQSMPDLQALDEQSRVRHAAASSSSSSSSSVFSANATSFLQSLTTTTKHSAMASSSKISATGSMGKHSTSTGSTGKHSSSRSSSKHSGGPGSTSKHAAPATASFTFSGPGSKIRGQPAVSSGSSSSGVGATPSSMRITYTKVGSGTAPPPTQAGQKQVIIMSSGNTVEKATPAEAFQRSQSMPASAKVTMATMSEVKQPGVSSKPSVLADPQMHYQPPTKHHRSKSSSKHKASKQPAAVQHTASLPMSTAPSHVYSTTAASGVNVVPTVIGTAGKRMGLPPQRSEPGMKLITQTVASGVGKVTSKTYQVSATPPSPTVRTTTIGMQPLRMPSTTGPMSPAGGALRNVVTTTGPRIMTLPSPMTQRAPPSTSNVITLSSMAVQKAGGKGATTTVVVTKPGPVVPGKTNVIVVQKSQIKSKMIGSPRPSAPGIMSHTTSILTRPKIAMTMPGVPGGVAVGGVLPPAGSLSSPGTVASIRFPSPSSSIQGQKNVRGPAPVTVGPGGSPITASATFRGRSPVMLGAGGPVVGSRVQGVVRPKSPIAQTMAMLSADLELQSKVKGQKRSTSLPQGASILVTEEAPAGVMRSTSLGCETPPLVLPPGGKPSSGWPEHDGTPPQGQQSASSAIKALLEFRGIPTAHAAPPQTSSTVKQVGPPGSSPTSMTLGSKVTVTQHIPPPDHSTPGPSQPPVPTQQAREPSQPNVVTVEVRGGQAERLEFSADQLSSVVDHFEQFLDESNVKETNSNKPPSLVPGKTPQTPTTAGSIVGAKPGGQTGAVPSPSASKMDPFEFVEEIISKDTESSPMVMSTSTSSSVLKEAAVTLDSPAITQEPHAPTASESQVSASVSGVATTATAEPLASVEGEAKTAAITAATPSNVGESATEATPPNSKADSASAAAPSSSVGGATASTAPTGKQPAAVTSASPATSVVMESTATFDITQMNLEDLSCQRMREEEDDGGEDGEGEEEDEDDKRGDDEPGSATETMSFFDTSSGGSGSEGVAGSDSSLRVSRRKRKAPTPIDEETGPSSMPSWARAAWNLLQRVMRFRGANRPKGGINAASWFTRPVDPVEAPNYHKVIKKPMDFGTIKKNLEAALYQDFGEFHHDMMLVRNNCLKFNPPGHAARRDCEEVFQFYTSEYAKTLDRWQKQVVATPKSPKRLKTDLPPALPAPGPTPPQLP